MSNADMDIINELTKIYPVKGYLLSEIQREHPDLYKRIQCSAKMQGKTPSKYLQSLGLQKNSSSQQSGETTKIFYDVATMTRLFDEYEINQASLAKLMECTRNNINLKMKKGISFDKDKWLIPFNQDEIEMICDFIMLGKESGKKNDLSFKLVSGKSSLYQKAIVLRNRNTIKVAFEIPSQIQNVLCRCPLGDHSSAELEALEKLMEGWSKQGAIENRNKKSLYLTQTEKAPFRKWAQMKGIDIEEYFEREGYYLEDRRTIPEDEIIAKIKMHSDSSHRIMLRSEDDDYHFFAGRASRQGQSIYDFFKSYGYTYERGHYVGNTNEKHRNIIRNRYIVQDNRIYISSYDQYYGTLASFARIKGKTLDEFVEELGFIRINDVNDLPVGYKIYDYTEALSSTQRFSDDNIASALSLISSTANEVYLDVTSNLYFILMLKAKMEGIDITSLVEYYGYKRVSKPLGDLEIEAAYEDVELDLEDIRKNYINKQLDDLRNLESSFSVQLSQEAKISRNKNLVSILKEIYQGKCQLCDPENPIPYICKENGELYSEVHHITSLHTAVGEDDIKEIDSYKNTIVLCPHHHKYIHYHHGGFNKIVKEEGILYFTNLRGERIRIYTNYHLDLT